MANLATESNNKVNMDTHYKGMIAEQNAQIYKQYERISDLLKENSKLKADIVELSAELNELK
jgi:predicted RNase H-like nuclease (RuvC/YqgF family)